MANVVDPHSLTYALEMMFKVYIHASAAACSIVLVVAGLQYVRNTRA